MTRAWIAIALCFCLHCSPPGAGIPHTAASTKAPSPTPDAGARTIATIRYGNHKASGGVDLTCTHDGAAKGTYMNAGFSPGGAEILPVEKKMTEARVAELWSAAESVVQAMPAEHEAEGAGWKGASSIVIHFSEGDDLVLFWPSDGAHPDKRVQRLAALIGRVLSDP